MKQIRQIFHVEDVSDWPHLVRSGWHYVVHRGEALYVRFAYDHEGD